MSICVSYVGEFRSDIGSFLVSTWVLLWHQTMEEAVVHEVLCVLHAQILIVLIVQLDLAH